MSLLQHTWNTISNWGIEDELHGSGHTEIKLSNQLSVVFVLLTISLFVLSYLFENQIFAVSLFSFFFLFSLIPLLNFFKLNRFSRTALSLFPNLILLLPAFLFAGIQSSNFQAFTYLSVIFGVLPFLIFNLKSEQKWVFTTFGLNLILVSIYSFHLPNLFLKTGLVTSTSHFYFENIPQVVLMVAIAMLYLYSESRRKSTQNELENKIGDLKGKNRVLLFSKLQLENEKEELKENANSLLARNKTLDEQAYVMLQLAKNEFIQKGIITGALEEIVRTISLTLSVSRTSIWEFNEASFSCVKLYSKIQNTFFEGFSFEMDNSSAFVSTLKSDKPIIDDKQLLNDFYLKAQIPRTIKSMVCTPYFVGGELHGVIICEQAEIEKQWTTEDTKFLEVAGDVLTISYSSNQLRTESEGIKSQHKDILSKNEFIEKQKDEILEQNKSLEKNKEELQKSLDLLNEVQEELGKKEAESSSILDAINDHNLVVEYDLKGDVTWMNERTMELTGITKKDLEGSYRYSIKSLLLRSNHFNHVQYDTFWSSILRGVSRKYELQIVLPGQKIWVAATFLPIRNSKGEVYRLLAMAHDISTVKNQQKHIEQQNQKLKEGKKEIVRVNSSLEHRVEERTEQLEKQNEQLLEYAFINAHLLRAPVCNILGLIDLLKNYEFSEDQMDIIKFLDTSTKELDEMVMKINRSIKKGYYDDPELQKQVENYKKRREQSKLKRA